MAETHTEPPSSTPLSGAVEWRVEPFTFGTPEQYARVRDVFARIGFTERGICERAKVDRLHDLIGINVAHTPLGNATDAQSTAVHLFIEGTALPWADVRSLFEPWMIDAFQGLGLLASSIADPAVCVAPLSIYPLGDLYIASDRHGDMCVVATSVPADVVYSALGPQARQFQDLMPRVQCDDYLELCSGSGIAALIAARSFAKHAWGIDITERSTRFARFNAAMNGLENVTMLQGDLWAPVAGQMFDVITAHPPYVPSVQNPMVFRDGGDDGEHISRRILVGLADHLRPGGLCFCDCMMTDRKGMPIERRVREMLGPSEREFDIIVGESGMLDLDKHFSKGVRAGDIDAADAAVLRKRFEELGVEQFVGVGVLLHRRATAATHGVITRRRVLSHATTGDDLLWYLRWSELAAEPEMAARCLDSRPVQRPSVTMRSRSELKNGRWMLLEAVLATEVPFIVEAKAPTWLPTLISWCDGVATARQLLARSREAELLPDTFPDAEFGSLMRMLADGGFIELDFCPHRPRVEGSPAVA